MKIKNLIIYSLILIIILIYNPYTIGNAQILDGLGELSFTKLFEQITIKSSDPSIIFKPLTSGDTRFWIGIQEDSNGVDDDTFRIGDGNQPGTNSFVTINTSGYVGIGRTSPTANLDIYGSDFPKVRNVDTMIELDVRDDTGGILFNDANTGATFVSGNSGGLTVYGVEDSSNIESADLHFSVQGDGDVVIHDGKLKSAGDIYLDDGSGNSPEIRLTCEADAYARWYKESGGHLYTNLFGDSNDNFFWSRMINSGAGSSGDSSFIGLGLENKAGGAYFGARIRWIISDANNNSEDMELAFHTGADGDTTPDEAMRIDENGYIGIGDTSPDAQTDIQCGAAGTIGLIVQGAASQSADILQILNSSGTELLTITKDGYLGVNSASPSYKLDVNGSGQNAAVLNITPSDIGNSIRIAASGVIVWADGVGGMRSAGTDTGDFIKFETNGSNERIRITKDGDVGINTSSPGGQLDISPGTTGGLHIEVGENTVNMSDTNAVICQVNVPSGNKIIGVQLRVDTALAGGDTWDAAYSGGSTQSIATNQAVDQNTKKNAFYDENAASANISSETDVTISKNGGGHFTAQGTIRAIVYYYGFTAMGDAS